MKMKKTFLILFVMFSFVLGVNGQTLLTEDFSGGQMPPEGWSIDGYSSQWTINQSNKAGGTVPEARFKYVNSTGVTRFISPEIDLTGYDHLNIAFKHYLDNYDAGPKIGLATRSGGGEWHVVWEVNTTNDIGPEEKNLAIENEDVGASDFQFCLYADGYFYNLDYWYIDDIEVYAPLNIDAKISAITTPWYFNGDTTVTGILNNRGINDITSFELYWTAGTGDTLSTLFEDLNISSGENYDFTCPDIFSYPVGAYDLNVWISSVNGEEDNNHENDTLSKTVHVASYATDRRPMFEEFTSSTCAPCATFNNTFVPWCDDHEDEITLVKYQMNWPGSGDAYYTEEGGVRRNYYGVSYVPDLIGNGSRVATNLSAVNAFFNEAVELPAFADFAASHTFNGTEITVNVNMIPFADYSDFRLYVVVFENITTGNQGNNGETEFQHVMMKMIPDAEGTTINVNDREPFNYTETMDLAGTHVEEWDDLGVAIILQDYPSREIFQSDYSVEDAEYNTEARLSDLQVNGESISDFDPDIFTYNVELPEGTTEIPEVIGTPMDENATVIVVPATELRDNTTTIDVFAEDHYTHNQYTITFTVATGTNELSKNDVRIYPNPTTGVLNISSHETAEASLYTANGSLIETFQVNNTKRIDLSNLPNGIYFIRVKTEDQVITKKISLTK
jgi:hypothetical protein